MHTLSKIKRVCDIALILLEKETTAARGLPIYPKPLAQQVREKTNETKNQEDECKRLLEQCFPDDKIGGTETRCGLQNVDNLAFNDQSCQTSPIEPLNSAILVSKTTNKECKIKSEEIVLNKGKDLATTAKSKEEKLVPKIEVLDEPKLIETDPKNDLVIHPPKLLGGKIDGPNNSNKYTVLSNSDLDRAYDELAKRCLHAPDDKICEVLLQELSKFSVPHERQRLLVRRVMNERERNRPPRKLSYPFTTLTQFPTLPGEHEQDSIGIQTPNQPNLFNLTQPHLTPVEDFDFAYEVALATKISIEQLRTIVKKDIPTIQRFEDKPTLAKTVESDVQELSKASLCVNDYCFNHPRLSESETEGLKKTPTNSNFVDASSLEGCLAANNFMSHQPVLFEGNEDEIQTLKLESPHNPGIVTYKGVEQFNKYMINTQGMVVSSVDTSSTVIPPQGLPRKIETLLLGQLPTLDEDLSMNELLKRMRSRNKMIYLREQCFSNIAVAPKGSCKKPCPPCKKPTPCPPPTPVCPQPPPPPACPPPKPCPNPCKPKCPSPCPPPCPPPKNPCLKFSKSTNTMTLILNWDTKDGISNLSLLVDEGIGLKKNLSQDLTAVLEKACKSISSAECVTVSEDFEAEVVGLRGKDYEPWVPIPCWPLPQKEVQRPLVCPKDGCQDPAPKLNPPCEERPCDGFPKRKFSLVNFMF